MKFLFFAFKSLSRNPVRATLTLLGVGVAIFLFTGVVSLDQGMQRMLANSAGDDTLVVFDKYQGCPPLSKLPTSYEAQVAELSGVAETTPTLFLLSACSRATDLVAVHGIEPEKFRRFRKIDIPEEHTARSRRSAVRPSWARRWPALTDGGSGKPSRSRNSATSRSPYEGFSALRVAAWKTRSWWILTTFNLPRTKRAR